MSNYSNSSFSDSSVNTVWYKIFNLIPDKTRVLDIGCSSGNFGEVLIKNKQCIVDGVEINQEDRALASKKLNKVYDFNIENSFPEELRNVYDFVYFGDVLEHLIYPVRALKNSTQLLNDHGVILFSIPNMSHLLTRINILAGKFGYGETGLLDKTHLHFYDFKEVSRIFNEAGLKIDKVEYVTRDIPKGILDNELDKVGLKASDKFYKLAQSTEATAYQICGIAKLSNVRSVNIILPKIYPPTDEMAKHIKKLSKLHEQDILRVKQHYERLLAEEKSINEQLVRKLTEFQKLKLYKFPQRINEYIKKKR